MRGFGFLRHSLVKIPSPRRTLPGKAKGCPEAPKQFSTAAMRWLLISVFARWSTISSSLWREENKEGSGEAAGMKVSDEMLLMQSEGTGNLRALVCYLSK